MFAWFTRCTPHSYPHWLLEFTLPTFFFKRAIFPTSFPSKNPGRLGLGPQQAMHMAERLYLDGYLTYPRTETNTYPKNFDLQVGWIFSCWWENLSRSLEWLGGCVGRKMLGSYNQNRCPRSRGKSWFWWNPPFLFKFMKMASRSSLLTAFQRDQGAVRAQTGHPAWGSYSNDLLSWGLARPREGSLKKLFMEFTLASNSSLYMMSKKVADWDVISKDHFEKQPTHL